MLVSLEAEPDVLWFLLSIAASSGVSAAATSHYEREARRASHFAESHGGHCSIDPSTFDNLNRRKFRILPGANQGPPVLEALFNDDKSSRLVRLTQTGKKVIIHLRARPALVSAMIARLSGQKARLTPPFENPPDAKIVYGWGAQKEETGATLYSGTLSFRCRKCQENGEYPFSLPWPNARSTYAQVKCAKCGMQWGFVPYDPRYAPDPLGES